MRIRTVDMWVRFKIVVLVDMRVKSKLWRGGGRANLDLIKFN